MIKQSILKFTQNIEDEAFLENLEKELFEALADATEYLVKYSTIL